MTTAAEPTATQTATPDTGTGTPTVHQPPTTALVPTPKRETRVVVDDSEAGYLMDTAKFEHTCRIAGMMARAGLIPKHLKGDTFEETQANCFLVVNQSLRWGFDPFSVAPCTYEVGGKLGFEGKLIAAVVNTRAKLAQRLSYTFNDAKGDALEVTVSGTFVGETEPRTVTVSVGQAKTSNQMWGKDPQQKLIYTGSIKWARRHCPEVVLGVFTDDDIDAINEERKFLAASRVKTPEFEAGPKRLQTAVEVPGATATPGNATAKVEPETPATEPAAKELPKVGESAATTEFKPKAGESEVLTSVRFQMVKAGITEKQVLAHAKETGMGDKKALSELSEAKLGTLNKAWPNIIGQLRAFPN